MTRKNEQARHAQMTMSMPELMELITNAFKSRVDASRCREAVRRGHLKEAQDLVLGDHKGYGKANKKVLLRLLR